MRTETGAIELLFHRLQLVLCCLFVVVLSATPAQADEKTSENMTPELLAKIRAANDQCFSCHSEQGFKNPPAAHAGKMDMDKLRTQLQDPKAFNGSNHGLMECTKCHGEAGYRAFPHAPDAKDKLSPCEECHAVKVLKVEMQFEASVHAVNIGEKFNCSTCHSPHIDLIASKLIDPAKIVAQDNLHCINCHDSDIEFAKFAPDDEKTLVKKVRPDIDSLHNWLPNARLHWKAVRCVDCHTPEAKTLSHEIVDKEKAEKRCVACHSTASSLTTRLYRHLAKEEQQKLGFVNSVVLSNSYVPGATRHPVLDTLLMIAFGAMVAGLLAHGLGRVVARAVKRSKNNG